MIPRSLHIARDGEKLGRVLLDELGALVQSGFLRPEDDFWEPGMSEWRPLNQLQELRSNGNSPDAWKRDAKSVMADAAGFLARGTAALAEGARSLAGSGIERTPEATQKLLKDFLPEIHRLAALQLAAKPFLAAKTALDNDELMHRAFEAIYDELPGSVARLVTESSFVGFCHNHRAELFAHAVPPPTTTLGGSLPGPLKLSHVRVLASEFTRVFEFYRDTLQLGVRFHEEGVYAEFDTGPALLAIFHREYMADALYTGAPHELAQPLQKPMLIFSVPDVDATYVVLKERGVEFMAEPTNRGHWGIRTAHLQDPEGNLIEINSTLR